MSGLISDICNNVKIPKKKSNTFLRWITILLPYIVIGSFAIGGGWYTYTNKIKNVEKKQNELSSSLNSIKTNIHENNVIVNDKIDKINDRIDRLYDRKINENK